MTHHRTKHSVRPESEKVAQRASDSHFERHFRVIIEGFRVIIEGFRVSIELETDSLLYPVLLDSDGHGPAGQI